MPPTTRVLFTNFPELLVKTRSLSITAQEYFIPLLKEPVLNRDYITLGDLVGAFKDHINLYRYFTLDTIMNWLLLMRAIRRDNPFVPTFEIHFYCEEQCVGFYFEGRDDDSYWYHEMSFIDVDAYKERYSTAPRFNNTPKTMYQLIDEAVLASQYSSMSRARIPGFRNV